MLNFFFYLFWVFQEYFNKHGCNFDDFKIKVFWNKGHGVIIFVQDVTKKNLSRDSNYTIVLIMWPKFGKSSIIKFYTSVEKGLKLKEKNWEGTFLPFPNPE